MWQYCYLRRSRQILHEKIGLRDKDWETAVYKGLLWERLSYKMDIEKPRAARVISTALNDKNSFAMQTGHTEIMAFICRNVNPKPQVTLFEPIRMELIAMHGSKSTTSVCDMYLYMPWGLAGMAAIPRSLLFSYGGPKDSQIQNGGLQDCRPGDPKRVAANQACIHLLGV